MGLGLSWRRGTEGVDQPHSTPTFSPGTYSPLLFRWLPLVATAAVLAGVQALNWDPLPQGSPGLRICIPWLLMSYS